MVGDGVLDPRPVIRVDAWPDAPQNKNVWPFSIPAVGDLMGRGLELDDLTILVGENGAGKSTIIEAVAMAFGFAGEGGSINGRDSTWASESPLHSSLRLIRGGAASRWGYFLRAETMHGMFTYLQSTGPEQDFHSRSHGEAFWDIASSSRFADGGLFILDEPESGLSFDAQLRAVAWLSELAARRGAQVLMATHSPVLASVPGATLYELSEDGLERARWDELSMVAHYRRYLDAPDLYLRYLLE